MQYSEKNACIYLLCKCALKTFSNEHLLHTTTHKILTQSRAANYIMESDCAESKLKVTMNLKKSGHKKIGRKLWSNQVHSYDAHWHTLRHPK